MTRWQKNPEVLEAARRWRERCLLDDGSILSDKRLWTRGNLAHLDRFYLQNLDAGAGNFLSKLEEQLAPAPAGAKQLAAEILWIMYLCVYRSAMRGATKRLHIRKVWNWSGEPLSESTADFGSALDEGVANPGPGFNNHKWRELAFAIELMREWKSLSAEEQQQIAADPWVFAAWLDALPSSSGRQFRHMLLYLLFPEHFERMVTASHKRRVVQEFFPRFELDPAAVDMQRRVDVDRALFSLRGPMEQQFGEDFDYYHDPVRSKWSEQPEEEREERTKPTDLDLDAWYNDRFGDARVWLMSAGEGARLWPDFQAEGMIAIGWDHLGDLTSYDSREEVQSALRQPGETTNPTNDSLACWQFAHEIRPGDHVLVKQGRSIVLGHGIVTSDYAFDEDRAEYQHKRPVDWKSVGRWVIPSDRHVATKTLTDFERYKDWLHWFFDQVEAGGKSAEDGEPVEYTLAQAMKDVFMPPEHFSDILDALARKKNVILEGPPGVGKTFLARRIAWALMGQRDQARVETVQFHQSYAYEDFIQGWRPCDGGFELKHGVFHQFCQKAQVDPARKYVFIIDEINRGNLSKVFGELMMLIETDKRGKEFSIPLTYSRSLEERFHVPENIYVLGLMNTADRSLAMVDYALRRRFSFIRLEPQFHSEGFTNHLGDEGVPEPLVERIVERMTELNRSISSDSLSLGRGFEIGHSFFVPSTEEEGREEAWYENVIRHEIKPLLEEYWFDQPENADAAVKRLLE